MEPQTQFLSDATPLAEGNCCYAYKGNSPAAWTRLRPGIRCGGMRFQLASLSLFVCLASASLSAFAEEQECCDLLNVKLICTQRVVRPRGLAYEIRIEQGGIAGGERASAYPLQGGKRGDPALLPLVKQEADSAEPEPRLYRGEGFELSVVGLSATLTPKGRRAIALTCRVPEPAPSPPAN
jgi:hypothetical protein